MDDEQQWMEEQSQASEEVELPGPGGLWHSLAPTRDEAMLTDEFEKLLPKIEEYVFKFGLINIDLVMSPDFRTHSRRIKKILLPSLQGKLLRVSHILFSPEQKANANIKDQWEALKEVEDVTDQIATLIVSFRLPRPHPAAYSRSTKCTYVTNHRCELTQFKMGDLMDKLTGLLMIYGAALLLAIRVHDTKMMQFLGNKLIQDTHFMVDYIDVVIKWLGLSDLGIIQDQWGTMAQDTEDLLRQLVDLPAFHPS